MTDAASKRIGRLLVLPSVAIFTALFVVPMAALVIQSFSTFNPANPGLNRDLTSEHYARFLSDSYYAGALLNTIRLGVTTVAITLLVGFPFAHLLNQSRGALRFVLVYFLLAPLLVSSVVRTFGWISLLNSDGIVTEIIGVRLLYTEWAVVIGLVHVLIVFMVIPITESLRTIDPQLRLAASTLGAGPVQSFRRVTLPLAMPGVVAGSLIVFALSTSTFVTPRVLGGPNVTVMAYLTIRENLYDLNWGFGAALAIITLVVSASLLILFGRRFGRRHTVGAVH